MLSHIRPIRYDLHTTYTEFSGDKWPGVMWLLFFWRHGPLQIDHGESGSISSVNGEPQKPLVLYRPIALLPVATFEHWPQWEKSKRAGKDRIPNSESHALDQQSVCVVKQHANARNNFTNTRKSSRSFCSELPLCVSRHLTALTQYQSMRRIQAGSSTHSLLYPS